MNTKLCTQCNEDKSINDFWKDNSSKTGRKPYCKVCGKKYNDYQIRSKDDHRKYWVNRKERYKNDPEYHQNILAKRRQYTIDNPEKILYGSARIRAQYKELEFTITLDDIIIPEYCPILGTKINCGSTRRKGRDSASLDRVDITKGYIKGNVRVISDQANTMKNNATFKQLRSFSKNIIKYINGI